MSVVKLSRLCNLAFTSERRVAPSQVRKRRGKRVPVQHLRHTGLGRHRLLLVTPITSGERVLEAIRDGVWLDGKVEIELFVGLNAL